MKKFLFIVICVVLLGGVIVSGCGTPEETTTPTATTPATTTPATTPAATSDQKEGGILISISNESPVVTLGSPSKYKGIASGMVRPIMETLLWSDPQGNWHPLLATGHEWSEDHKSVTFTLRQDVKFHDGTDFDAEAVKWNLEDRMENSREMGMIESVEVIDDYTVRVNLFEYDMMFLLRMEKGMGIGYIISPTAFEEKGEDYINWHPVGTGPFKFKEFQADEYLEFERNDDYWGERPYLDGIKNVFIADPISAQLAFEAGDGHRFSVVARSNEVAAELEPKGYEFFWGRGGLIHVLAFDSVHPDSPFANLKVREAVEYAVNKKEIVDTVSYGYWELNYQMGVLAPLGEGYQREYNPDKARQLLEEAGYPNGFDTTFYCGTNFEAEYIPVLVEKLNDVGIRAKLELITPGLWLEYEHQPPEGTWQNGIMYSVMEPGDSIFAYADEIHVNFPTRVGRLQALAAPEGLKELQTAFFSSTDPEEQLEIAYDMEMMIWENAMVCPLWTVYNAIALQPTVHDMYDREKYRIDHQWNFSGCWIEK
jgi:peptide/nickel transport system substrate-binding protein